MKKLILCTVGTSVLDPGKYRYESPYDDVDRLYQHLYPGEPIGRDARSVSEEVLAFCRDSQKIESIVKNLKDRVPSRRPADQLFRQHFSAEVYSLLQLERVVGEGSEKSYGNISQSDKVVLLFSDTPDGGLAAYLNGRTIAEGLLGESLNPTINLIEMATPQPEKPMERANCIYAISASSSVEAVRIKSLSVDNSATFKAGLKNLLSHIREYGGKNDFDVKLFIYTGGYKGIVPIDTLCAWSKGFSCFYVNETGSEMICFRPPRDFSLTDEHVDQFVDASQEHDQADGKLVKQDLTAGLLM